MEHGNPTNVLDSKPDQQKKSNVFVMDQERKCAACAVMWPLKMYSRNQLARGMKARCQKCVNRKVPLSDVAKKTPQRWKRPRGEEDLPLPSNARPQDITSTTPVRAIKRAKPVANDDVPSSQPVVPTNVIDADAHHVVVDAIVDSGVSSSAPPVSTTDAHSSVCVVCLDRPRDCVISPCFHLALCLEDASALFAKQASCPVCRGRITSISRVFLA
jgi:hypothetical protein